MLPEPLRGDPIAAELQAMLGDEYALERIVGQGGFGRVFRAHDHRLDRAVAVKVLMPELASEDFIARFRREGIALAKLRHPGVVPVYDIRSGRDLIALVMPFIDGETLRSRMARSARVPPKEVHRVVLELCDALGAAHRAGIIHRDIKPDNIILEGTLRKVLLMDFGIAVSRDAVESDTESQVGTPLYMSPEQIVGAVALDPRSDLYQLGAVAYHLLTGVPPFAASNPAAVMAMHLSDPVVPIRVRNPSVPMAFAEILERCLAKERADRPADVWEVARALHAVHFDPIADRRAQAPRDINPSTAFFGGVSVATLACALFAPASTPILGLSPWLLLSFAAAGLAVTRSQSVMDDLRAAVPSLDRREQPARVAGSAQEAVSADAEVTAASLFEALPKELRERFADVPDVLRRLEGAIVLLRARAQVLAQAVPQDPERASELATIESRLAAATDALAMMRTDILQLTIGAVTPGELTTALDNARALNGEVARLIAAGREVEGILDEGRARARISQARERIAGL